MPHGLDLVVEPGDNVDIFELGNGVVGDVEPFLSHISFLFGFDVL
jgi:hypothetical protein